MRRPGGAVWPQMKPTTGLVTWALMKAAASSSAVPPISPIIMIEVVSGSAWKSFEHVDEVGAVDRVAPDAHAGGLAEAALGELVDDLVGQRAAARDHAHVADLVDVARHDPDLGLARRDQARAVGADEAARGAGEEGLHPHHVRDRHALGDADDERHARVGRFHDGVGRGGRRHEDQRAVGAGGLDRLLHRVPDREALVGGPALARRHPAHHLGAVLLAPRGVEGALLAGDALHQHPRVLVDQDAHLSA